MNEAESHLASLAIVKTIVSYRQVRPGEQNLGQCKRNAVFRLIDRFLGGIEHISHGCRIYVSGVYLARVSYAVSLAVYGRLVFSMHPLDAEIDDIDQCRLPF